MHSGKDRSRRQHRDHRDAPAAAGHEGALDTWLAALLRDPPCPSGRSGYLRARVQVEPWICPRAVSLCHVAVLSDEGQYYLEHGRYPEPPPAPQAEPGDSLTASRPTATEALVSARRAIRRATADQERRSLRAARARACKQAVRSFLLKDIPMRYKIVVSRVQTAERHVRAVSEEDAIRKVQEEMERPYGFLGGWTTAGTEHRRLHRPDCPAAGSPEKADYAGPALA